MVQDRFHDIWRVFDLGEPETVFRQIFRALDDEIEAEQESEAETWPVDGGEFLHGISEGYVYRVAVRIPKRYPSETTISLRIGEEQESSGALLSHGDFEAVILLNTLLEGDFAGAELTVWTAPILVKLRSRLAGECTTTDEHGQKHFSLPVPRGETAVPHESGCRSEAGGSLSLPDAEPMRPDFRADDATEAVLEGMRRSSPRPPDDSQTLALRRMSVYFAHCIWGPPGAGKTRTLARAARCFAERGMSVTILSLTNAAVDVALMDAVREFRGHPALETGRILRYGATSGLDPIEYEAVLPHALIKRDRPDLWSAKEDCEIRLRSAYSRLMRVRSGEPRGELLREIDDCRVALAALQRDFRELVQAMLGNALVLGTTLARFALEDGVWKLEPEVVIIDEASIVPVPYILAAMMRASRALFVFGDFRQLPPVVRGDSRHAREWMGRDIFDISGIRRHIENDLPDRRYTLLDTQYRMHDHIADAVSVFAYGGRLRNAAGVRSKAEAITTLAPAPGSAVVIADTSLLKPAAMREGGGESFSRANVHHALLVLQLAYDMARQGAPRTAIITPYALQARLLHELSEPLRSAGHDVVCATVHRYQGSEEDVVIVDTVDADPLEGPSALTGSDPDMALRLFNVSISRARGKLLFVADTGFLRRGHAAGSPLRRLVELLERNGVTVPAHDLLRSEAPLFRIARPHAAGDAAEFASLLGRSRRSLTLNLPAPGCGAEALLKKALELAGRGVRVICHAPFACAASFENSPLEFRLSPLHTATMAFIDDATVLLSGVGAGAPILGFEDVRLCGILRSVLGADSSGRLPGPPEGSKKWQD